MALWQFVGRRVLGASLLVAGAIVLNFLLIHIAPGDPALMLAGEAGGTSEETLRQIRAEFGLDRPLMVQLGVYGGRLVLGDFGYSYFYRRPVLELIRERVPATLLVALPALGLAAALGITFGTLVARRPTSLWSHALSVFSLIGYSMPVFWTGIMLLLIFSVHLGWLPSHGMQTVGVAGGWWERTADVAWHMILPVAALGTIFVALYSRLTRASMLEVLPADFVRTARAKGLGEARVVAVHALRNALLPVITVAGIQLGQALAGTVLVETVFSWPGMGRLAFESILRRDYPLLLGILFVSSLAVIVFNLLTDIGYGLLDPRIRHR
ncbi:MAG TPA: ABC transporter permease [Methylomirabilota bacterium]|jgi:peptide/nickel transport system permease protein|nr:ABC transporter permease [Methylomirabilota bacterium]